MEGIGKYFSKKRDLSDQSQGGDERKKVKEGSSASSTDDTDFLVKDWSQLIVRLYYSTAGKI